MWPFRRNPRLFRELANEILVRKESRSEKTQVNARLHFRQLNEFFGPLPVTEIDEKAWARFIDFKRQSNPKRKFYDLRKFALQVLLEAFRRGLIPRQVTLRIPDVPSEVGREITLPELERLFLHASPELAFQMEIALKMGLRLREMLHLQWNRFNWLEKTIRLRASDTKTRRGRVVPIPDELLVAFRREFEKTKSCYVFPHRFDTLRPQNDNKTAWRALKEKAEVKARWHDFRHTCATWMRRRGVPKSIRCAYLGHSEEVNEDYDHKNLEDLRSAAAAMSGPISTLGTLLQLPEGGALPKG